jgi:hypothetical protein
MPNQIQWVANEMRYAFLTNVFQWGSRGGPQSRARNIETMLKRHADFSYAVVKSGFDNFLERHNPDVVHIQSNNNLLNMAMKRKLRIIAGPNMVWNKAPKSSLTYRNMLCGLIQRPDPMPRKLNPSWPIRQFPAFVDEEFFVPVEEKKVIDVLTVTKSFNYGVYDSNIVRLTPVLKKMGLRHRHLKRYSLQEYKSALRKSKLFLFPSPKEAGASLCHALLECSMMNVPFIGLNSVVIENDFEYHPCRGVRAATIEELSELIWPTLKRLDDFHAREWVIERFSMAAGYQRLKNILEKLA